MSYLRKNNIFIRILVNQEVSLVLAISKTILWSPNQTGDLKTIWPAKNSTKTSKVSSRTILTCTKFQPFLEESFPTTTTMTMTSITTLLARRNREGPTARKGFDRSLGTRWTITRWPWWQRMPTEKVRVEQRWWSNTDSAAMCKMDIKTEVFIK